MTEGGTASLLPSEFPSLTLSWLLDVHVEGVNKQAEDFSFDRFFGNRLEICFQVPIARVSDVDSSLWVKASLVSPRGSGLSGAAWCGTDQHSVDAFSLREILNQYFGGPLVH